MKYKFTYQTTALDIWKLSMYNIYGSMVGVCNVIFIVAMLLLTVKFWLDVKIIIKVFLIIANCLFTIIQPIVVYIRAKRQVAGDTHDINLGFDDSGMHIKIKNKSSHLKWSMIKGVVKKPGMIIIFSTTKHGFVLTDKVIGEKKDSFYDYVILKTK